MSDIPELTLASLHDRLTDVMLRDRQRLERQWQQLQKQVNTPGLEQLAQAIARSQALVQQRRAAVPVISFPEQLPVCERRTEIADVISRHQVVILAGETGSGKTTQIPKICLALGRGITGMIGHTQPRRIAAHTVANRIAEELNTPLGETVGYQVRFTDHSGPATHIKLMTDGILLAEIQNDRYLHRYDTLIIDEAHERSLNIDFLLGYIKQILPRRPDLKVIVTSATIDLERFSRHFDHAPIIEVSGRTYPVDIHYRPMLDSDGDINTALVDTIADIYQQEKSGKQGGDILIFLPGERDIREAALAIRRADFAHLEVLPLYARLSLAEQSKVFQSGQRGRRVVLATNVAETSITVPGIRYVIDPGTARISRYSYRTKIQRLPVEAISQASANQRAGRCGRVSDGICIRLYEQSDFLTRPAFTDAEILRTNLAAVILQMLNLRIGDIRHFPFVDAPDQRLINDGFKLLQELQAVDSKSQVTALGKQLMTLPADPRLGRMLIAAREHNCVRELLIIVSALSVQDPRERPAEKQQAADEKHRRFVDEDSDFISWINLWNYVEEQRQALSQGQLRKQCQREFLSFLRLREWRDIHHQLRLAARQLGFSENSEPAGYEAIHRALACGLLGNIGFKTEEREYLGARNRQFEIFPGSSQKKKRPKWIMAAELLETSKVFAHTVAKIEPEWIQAAAQHLIKRNYFEPHYSVRSGQVMAFEKITLYGLTLVEKKRVSYGAIDPQLSRDVFIREALVEGGYKGSGEFFRHNQRIIAGLDELEAKSRRRDILVDDQVLIDFYQERVPAGIVNLAGFEHWRKEAEQQQPQLLHVDRAHLMQHDASHITAAQFPDSLAWDGMQFALKYHFEPGHSDDGVSVQVPVAALHLLPENRLQWVVPGILREKCIALVKNLPKQWRKNFVPVPDYVDQALKAMQPDNTSLTEALALQLKRQTGVQIPAAEWQDTGLDNYYRMNIQVVDDRGHIIDRDRDLQRLRERYRDQLQATLRDDKSGIEQTGLTDWSFAALPETVALKRAGMSITAYPALLDRGDSVDLQLLDNPQDALYQSRRAIARLLALQLLNGDIKKRTQQLLKGKDIGLTMVNLGTREAVAGQLLVAAVYHVGIVGMNVGMNVELNDGMNAGIDTRMDIPRDRTAFTARLHYLQPRLSPLLVELEALLVNCLQQVVAVRKAIKTHRNPLALALAAQDINQQLQALFYPGFLLETPLEWLREYPRYLKAIGQRLEKVDGQLQRDKLWTAEIHALWQRWQDCSGKLGPAAVAANAALVDYRWLIEEYRVSLFAQTLKTRVPVSAKRLQKLWQELGVG